MADTGQEKAGKLLEWMPKTPHKLLDPQKAHAGKLKDGGHYSWWMTRK